MEHGKVLWSEKYWILKKAATYARIVYSYFLNSVLELGSLGCLFKAHTKAPFSREERNKKKKKLR